MINCSAVNPHWLGDVLDCLLTQILKKFKRAVTDSEAKVKYDEEKKPAVSNLLTIYNGVTGSSISDIEKKYEGKGYGDFKKDLGEAVIAALTPIQKKIEDLYNKGKLDKKEISAMFNEEETFAIDIRKKDKK